MSVDRPPNMGSQSQISFKRFLPVFVQIKEGGDINKLRLEEKQKITEDLHERFSKSAIVVVTDYKGLDVSAMNDLRRKLREEDIEFQVAKNTLLMRAAKDTEVALIQDYFKGPSAVALSYNRSGRSGQDFNSVCKRQPRSLKSSAACSKTRYWT